MSRSPPAQVSTGRRCRMSCLDRTQKGSQNGTELGRRRQACCMMFRWESRACELAHSDFSCWSMLPSDWTTQKFRRDHMRSPSPHAASVRSQEIDQQGQSLHAICKPNICHSENLWETLNKNTGMLTDSLFKLLISKDHHGESVA